MAEVGSARRTGPADATGTTPVGRRGPLRNTWPDRWSLEFSERGFVSTEVQQKAALPSVGPGLIRPGRPAGRGSAGASEGPTRGAKGIPKRPDRESVARWRIRVRTDPGPTERSPRTGTDRALCIDLKRLISPGIIAIGAFPETFPCELVFRGHAGAISMHKARSVPVRGLPAVGRPQSAWTKRAEPASQDSTGKESGQTEQKIRRWWPSIRTRKRARSPDRRLFVQGEGRFAHHRIPDPNSTRSISSCFAWMLSFS